MRLVIMMFILAAGGVIAWLLLPAPLVATDWQRAAAGALAAATILAWATGIVAEAVTAIAFFAVAMLTGVAPADVVFSGLTSSGFWLIFSGLVIGVALKGSGLADRVAGALVPAMTGSFARALTGVVCLGLALAFLMPSAMGRILLLLPIVALLTQRLGYEAGSRGSQGLTVAAALATVLPSAAILPSNVPNNVLAGLAESSLGAPLSYAGYLAQHFPVLGLGKALLLLLVLLVAYRREVSPPPAEAPVAVPWSQKEVRMALIAGGALLLWATDAWHRVSPAWVGMGAAVLCLLPPLRLLPPRALQTISFEPLFYVAGIMGVGALIAHAGLGQSVAAPLPGFFAQAQLTETGATGLLAAVAAAVGLLVTVPGVPAVLVPVTDALSAASGTTVATVLAAQVIGFSTVFLPYQAPPLVMAMQVASLPRRDMTRLCLVTGLLSILVLWPLDLVWLALIGS